MICGRAGENVLPGGWKMLRGRTGENVLPGGCGGAGGHVVGAACGGCMS